MYSVLIFDLDDTILDTWQYLIPKAAQATCKALVKAGLKTTVAQCVHERANYLLHNPRGDVYRHLVQKFGVKNVAHADVEYFRKIGRQAYLRTPTAEDIKPLQGAIELLTSLHSKYRLHLVTSGHSETQQVKIRLLNVSHLFHKIWVVDPQLNESKTQAFKKIMLEESCPPEQILCVGNRLDLEIREGKLLGFRTCYLKYGEYAHLSPSGTAEIPDYQILDLSELVATCRL